MRVHAEVTAGTVGKEVTAERQEEVEVKIFPGCGSLHLETGLSGTLVRMK